MAAVCPPRSAPSRSGPTVADVLRAGSGPLLRERAVSPRQRVVLTRLLACRTEAMGGGHLYRCPDCGWSREHHDSCGDRHCPTCYALRAARWAAERTERLLPVGCFQVVVTLPEPLRLLARVAPARVYDGLIRVAAAVLQDVLKTEYDARFAITAVLHTWTRNLRFHPHVHLLVSAGGLRLDGDRWQPVPRDFLVSTRKIAPLLRARLLAWLRRARTDGRLVLPPSLDRRFAGLLDQAAQQTWVVHIDPPKGRTPATLVRYLARYIARVAIDDRRILALQDGRVTLSTRGHETVTLGVEQFVRRFVQHVLPHGFRKVRHYGLLAPSCGARLERARELLQQHREAVAEAEPDAVGPERSFEPPRCPRCCAELIVEPLDQARGPPVSRWRSSLR